MPSLKHGSTQAFIISLLLYGVLLAVGYWVFSQPIKKEPDLVPVAVTLAMFQAPQEQVVEPVSEEQPLIEPEPEKKPEPIEEPVEQPKPEPKPEPKPDPKPVVEPKPEPKPVPKPEPKPTPKPEPKPKPMPKPEPKVEPLPVSKPLSEAKPLPKAPPKATPKPAPKKVEPLFTPGQIATAEQQYLYALREEISMHAQSTYPRSAKRRQWEGTVMIQFTLMPNGKISQLALINSSGKSILDAAALSIFQERMNNQFKAFPKEIMRQEWQIKVPVNYQLN